MVLKWPILPRVSSSTDGSILQPLDIPIQASHNMAMATNVKLTDQVSFRCWLENSSTSHILNIF